MELIHATDQENVKLGILTGLPETDQLTFDFFMAQSQV